ADIDKDLRLDVVVGSSGDDEVAWYQNTFVPADPDVPGDVGHLVWIQHVVTTHAGFPRAISVVDLNDDGNLDIVVASSGDDTVAWYEQQRVPAATRENPTAPDTITFLEHVLSTTAKGARAVATGDLDHGSNANTASIDIAVGSLFRLAYHRAGAEEICTSFDVNEPPDGRIDGVELGWLGLAFGQVSTSCVYTPGAPAPWWTPIDLNRDCFVDGVDLAILTSTGVWGRSAV